MLRLAFGYLAMAIVLAIGFSSLSDGEPSARRDAPAAAQPTAKRVDRVPAYQDEADASAWEDDDSGWAGESGWQDGDSGWADESATDDQGFADEEAEASDLEYVIRSGAGGHFLVKAMVNGAPVTFLVDTGASSVVLTMEDAQRLGFRRESLRFTERFASANGEVRAAPVVLRELRIGQFSVFDLPASVNEAPLGVSLLGMSFLRRLHGYSVDDGRLILRW